ncbi:hypothetical protein COCCADRAFT_37377 [Bipolaris zeicola 26-R-13]|uniref:DUF3328 domain-containing protein n=1 Tax=Cochliobolus carbonum (strain 26-R-13) TaxID=930089 RepID=W6YB50_COCC2|nr:uncharacterized protein COCCADRAFT_37377 [Bipolaris zeicola 26-R-13]EUC32694.1 hypothetical protein COCCADRAFT_37377 [Bipolaris zeicola 26-R-13]
MYFFNHFRNKERSLYDALEHEDRQTDATTKKTKGLCSSTALPWGLSAFLLVALIFVAVRTETIDKVSELGTYEFGFVTDIEPARAAISLKRKKFYGGVNIDKHGSYSITKDPNSTDFFAPLSPKLDAAWREEMLLNGTHGFSKLTPDEIRNSGIQVLDEDLRHGHYEIQKSLARDYYTDITDEPERPYHMSHRMHLDHCLENIRQHLTCSFDLTWTLLAWRPEAKVAHAATDQWHVCRNFDAMMSWMANRV